MDIFAIIKSEIEAAAFTSEGDLPDFTVEPPKDAAHGDMASNIALILAKKLGRPPRDLAQEIADRLCASPRIRSAEVAGPGFINIRLSDSFLHDCLREIVKSGHGFARAPKTGRKINIEFVSANPTGPLHVGHLRGAVLGDALAGLLAFAGDEVVREYYVNDGGAQIEALARSIYLRYLEALGEEANFDEVAYPGDYLVPVGADLAREHGTKFVGASEEEWLALFGREGVDAMMALIREDLAMLGISMDVYYSEARVIADGQIEAAIADLSKEGLIYEGKLPPPKGKPAEDWEAREQTLFRSSEFGDDCDRPIKKADGSWTYFAPDVAYHYDKINRGFDELINILGADHGGYVSRLKAAVRALSRGKVALDVKLCQIVRLFKGGEPFKMSKRAGNFILVSDVIKEVGADVARFVILMRKPEAPLDFDFDKVREETRDNPVFYVQYAHARACSVLKKGEERFGALDAGQADLSLLSHEAELRLIREMAGFPRMIKLAASTREPHRVAYFLYELASGFHALQHLGKSEPELRFIGDDEARSKARLALVHALREVISGGLQILGVSPIEEM